MPIYLYKCRRCKTPFEMFFPLREWDVIPDCPDCGSLGDKILTAQVRREEPVWLDDGVRGALQDMEDPNARPIENRTEYNRYLKDNGILER